MFETNTGTALGSLPPTNLNESRVTAVILDNSAKMDWSPTPGVWLATIVPRVVVTNAPFAANLALSEEDWATLVKHLKNPPEPNEYLKALFRQP